MPSTGFMRQAGSMGLDFIPVVGNVKSGIEAIMGKDLVTGQKLSTTERIIAGVGIFTGGAGKTALKGISAGVSLGLTSSKAAKAVKATKGTGEITPAKRAAEKGYSGIGTTANGGPDFSGTEYLFKTNIGEKNIVPIKMTGSRGKDFTQAFDNANIPKSMRKSIKENFTWHHVDDFNPLTGESTMQLVRKDAHVATYPHVGSVSQYEKFYGVNYK